MIIYQVLDSIKVIFNGLVAFWTGLSVDLQASHQVFLKVCVNLHNRQASDIICNIQLDIKAKGGGNQTEKVGCLGCPSTSHQLLIS